MVEEQNNTSAFKSLWKQAFVDSKAAISKKFFEASSPQGMGMILERAAKAKEGHSVLDAAANALTTANGKSPAENRGVSPAFNSKAQAFVENVGAGIATPFVFMAEMAKQDIKYLKR